MAPGFGVNFPFLTSQMMSTDLCSLNNIRWNLCNESIFTNMCLNTVSNPVCNCSPFFTGGVPTMDGFVANMFKGFNWDNVWNGIGNSFWNNYNNQVNANNNTNNNSSNQTSEQIKYKKLRSALEYIKNNWDGGFDNYPDSTVHDQVINALNKTGTDAEKLKAVEDALKELLKNSDAKTMIEESLIKNDPVKSMLLEAGYPLNTDSEIENTLKDQVSGAIAELNGIDPAGTTTDFAKTKVVIGTSQKDIIRRLSYLNDKSKTNANTTFIDLLVSKKPTDPTSQSMWKDCVSDVTRLLLDHASEVEKKLSGNNKDKLKNAKDYLSTKFDTYKADFATGKDDYINAFNKLYVTIRAMKTELISKEINTQGKQLAEIDSSITTNAVETVKNKTKEDLTNEGLDSLWENPEAINTPGSGNQNSSNPDAVLTALKDAGTLEPGAEGVMQIKDVNEAEQKYYSVVEVTDSNGNKTKKIYEFKNEDDAKNKTVANGKETTKSAIESYTTKAKAIKKACDDRKIFQKEDSAGATLYMKQGNTAAYFVKDGKIYKIELASNGYKWNGPEKKFVDSFWEDAPADKKAEHAKTLAELSSRYYTELTNISELSA